ncbi:hypothetical protein [Paenibacillus naphthalenovorans]|uniref:Uncharacterized protein n=1 Tax=Paenibacillus naphthalenovorans TaxID=162209 RepID=A0A0U2M423_9BACL|nr:hypothetical protein [Paenibacillus naphthalenovorans]ALS22256.1 hypothetical protein IJ22_18820 [Paenibacillus naphthalenovorans]
MRLGLYIKDVIKKQGRTLKWVSDQLEMNERTFAGKLNRDSITGEELLRLSDILGIDLKQLKEEMLKMNITEYTVLDFKGMKGSVPYHYNVIKLGENMYYKGYDEDKIKVTSDIKWASHIVPKFGEETVGFIKKFYDEEGRRKDS